MKTISHFLFAVVLIFSILAPPAMNLFMAEDDVIVLMDTSEEEKREKTEKELEEKILQFDFLSSQTSIVFSKRKVAVRYLENNVDFALEINLPPPKQLV